LPITVFLDFAKSFGCGGMIAFLALRFPTIMPFRLIIVMLMIYRRQTIVVCMASNL